MAYWQPCATSENVSIPVSFADDEPLPENVTDPTITDSVRSEKVTIRAIPERPAVAASESLPEFTLLVGLKAPPLSEGTRRSQRAPVDLVTVLDVSGSMGGLKLYLLKTAVQFIIDNLGPSDRLSIVSFASSAQRITSLSRMVDEGRQKAKRAVDSLYADGSTNIVDALKFGVKVLEDRRQQNPVSTIIFLSDGNDNHNRGYSSYPSGEHPYLSLLPSSIFPRNSRTENSGQQATFPVHTFGFGTDHDPVVMHAIANASGGTFSFIESYEMLQEAFAICIGGLLSVVSQDLSLNLKSASHGVEIKSIASGRYASETSNRGARGILRIGDLYADEKKEFLISLSIPSLPIDDGDDETERKTSLLDITCSYRDMVSNDMVLIESELVEIGRPKSVSARDMAINLEVERQRNRLLTLLTITEAQEMAEAGNIPGAQAALSKGRSELLATASAQAGDPMCRWLDAEIEETRKRMVNSQLYMQHGRAYALAGMSSHTYQRAATRGNKVPGAASVTSPAYGGNAYSYVPVSPSYSPSSPAYSPTSPCYLPTAPVYGVLPPCPSLPCDSPTVVLVSPSYKPSAPAYSPPSPCYVPTAPAYRVPPPCASLPCDSPTVVLVSPSYKPSSPGYAPGGAATSSVECSSQHCGSLPCFEAYVTPSMANMVVKSKQQSEENNNQCGEK